jgi:DNA repair protein SbcD/Mre11
MRLLHTSDWHLGQLLHGASRDAEHAAFLGWLLEVVRERAIDALLLTGDVFDSAHPPVSAQARYFGFLGALARLPKPPQVVVISGNHDSAARLDAPAALLAALDIHVIGALRAVEHSVIALRDVSGKPTAQLVAVPFLRPADLPLDADPIAATREIYAERFALARARRTPNQALLATGHCYLVGGALSRLSERDIQRGYQDALPLDLFPDDVTYVALGHLHRAQIVGGRPNVRYAGSPLPLAFSEQNYCHEVTLVECDGAAIKSIAPLPIPRRVGCCKCPRCRHHWRTCSTHCARCRATPIRNGPI